MTKHWHLTATVWLLCNAVAACSGVEGARYTFDGKASCWQAAQPEDDMVLSFTDVWSRDEGGLSLGETDDKPIRAGATAPVGPWAPTADPYTYTFATTADVPLPDDAESPVRIEWLEVQSPMFGHGGGTVGSYVVGDDEDGWIPVQVAVTISSFHP